MDLSRLSTYASSLTARAPPFGTGAASGASSPSRSRSSQRPLWRRRRECIGGVDCLEPSAVRSAAVGFSEGKQVERLPAGRRTHPRRLAQRLDQVSPMRHSLTRTVTSMLAVIPPTTRPRRMRAGGERTDSGRPPGKELSGDRRWKSDSPALRCRSGTA
jgi:hypothetical protein